MAKIPKNIRELMSEEQLEQHDNQEKLRSLLIADMRDLFKDTRCQKLLFYILDLSNINGINYTGNNNETNHNLGKTYVGYGLLDLMEEVDPTLYPRLLLNHAKEKQK